MVATTTSIQRNLQSESQRRAGAGNGVNIGDGERWLSLAGGGLLFLYGFQRRDLAGLGAAVVGGTLLYRGLSGHCGLYDTLGVNAAGKKQSSNASVPANRGVKVVRAITIQRLPEEVYRIWRNFEELPRFMTHLKSVQVDGRRSHWVARAPAGMSIGWDAEIINDEPNRLIAWRSLKGSHVSTAGSVHFTPAPNGAGTEVLVEMKYDPPAGQFGTWLAWAFGQEPGLQVREDLLRLKQLLETDGASLSAEQAAVREMVRPLSI